MTTPLRPSVTIVVVTHNSAGHIGPCLDAIAASAYQGPVHTVVVDNASSDDTCAVVRQHPLPVHLIPQTINPGFGAACNLGMRETSGELVLLLNPDTRLLPAALGQMVDHLLAHPDVVIVGPRLLHDSGALQPDLSATGLFPSFTQALFEYTRLGRWWPHARWYRDYFLTNWDRLSTRPVAMVQGACFLVRRAVAESLGLLDESFFLYFEETDLCKRAADAGWHTHYVGEAACVHVGSHSMPERRASAGHFIASLYRFHRKHYGAIEAIALWLILMPYHALRVVRLAGVRAVRTGDAQLQRDLRTAWERWLAHFTLLTAPTGHSAYGDWRSLRLGDWRRIMGATPAQVVVPAVLALLVAALEGISLSLLVPMATGVTQRDFGFVRAMPVLGWVTTRLPSWFAAGPGDFAPLFVMVAAAAFAAAVVKNGLAYASHVLTARWNGHYLRRANDFVFARHLAFGKRYFDRANQGRLQTVMGYTGELLDLVVLLQRGLLTALLLLAHLAVMAWISWRLTLVVMAVFPLVHVAIRAVGRRTERLSRDLNEATLAQHATAYNILSAVPLFRAYGQEAAARERYTYTGDALRRLNLRLAVVQGVLGPFQEVVTLGTMLGLIGVVAFGLREQQPAQLAVFLVFFYAARGAVPKFTGLYEIRHAVWAKRPRLRELASLLDDTDKDMVPDGTVEFRGLRQSITIRDLHFAYRDGVPVLNGLSLTVPQGQVTALVGPSGGGKTTLVHLLMGFYPAPAGTIFLDGVDLTTFRLDSVRTRMALVSQDVFLFNDTIRANLAVATTRALTDAELWDALEQARLATLVRTLPQGLDTRIGDRGVQLSGGEQQRLAICRALLRQPDILILDEATSALDLETERLVQEAIANLMRGRTTIVIAHRVSARLGAHTVVTVDRGAPYSGSTV